MPFRVAARKGKLAAMVEPDRRAEARLASVRAKVEHPFLVVPREFGFTKPRYGGVAKNLNRLHVLFASAKWLMHGSRRHVNAITRGGAMAEARGLVRNAAWLGESATEHVGLDGLSTGQPDEALLDTDQLLQLDG